MNKLNNFNIPDEGGHEPYALTIEESARMARLSRSTIYLALGDGRLTAIKVGRRTLILPKDLRMFLETLPRFGKRTGAEA